MTKIYTYILTIFFIFTSASFADKNMMIGSKGKINVFDLIKKAKPIKSNIDPYKMHKVKITNKEITTKENLGGNN